MAVLDRFRRIFNPPLLVLFFMPGQIDGECRSRKGIIMATEYQSPVSLEDFRSIIATSVDGFTLINSSGDILDVNGSYCQMVGYSREELLKMHMSNVDAIDSAEDVSKRSEEIILSGSLRFETKQRHKDGTVIDVEVTANYSSMHGGLFFSIVRDITKQKQIEKELHKSEDLYRNIVENQSEFVDRYLPGGILTYVNEALVKFAGIPAEELLGKSYYPFIHEDEREDVVRQIESISMDHSLVEIESRIVLPDGKLLWNHWTHTGFFDESGTVVEYQSVGRDITERKTAEKALRDSENRFRSIFNNSPIAIGIGEIHSGLMVEVNDAWLKLFGFESDEVIGRTTTELSLYVRNEERDELVRIIKDQGRIVNHPIQLQQKSGELIDILYSAEIVTFNMKPCLQVMMTGITEYKKWDDLLRTSEEKYRNLFNNSEIAMFRTRLDGAEVLDVNQQFLNMLGRTREDTIGKPSVMLWADPKERDEMVRRLFADGRVSEFEFKMLNSQEGIRNCLTSLVLYREQEIVEGSILDITERKQSEIKLLIREQALERSERFLKTIIESEPECIKMLDIDGNLLMMNPAGLAMVGADSFEQVKGQCIYPLISDPYKDDFIALTKQVFQGIPGILQFEAIGLKGRHVWLDTHSVPFRNERGEIVALLGITRDITERKRLEEERVALEKQLQQTQKLESLGVLAGGIAHDFNNILAIIVGHCSLAEMNYEKAGDHITEIGKAASRAADLCRQMLAYAGKTQFVQNQVNMVALVDEMVNMLKSTIKQNVVIKPNLCADIPPIKADASQIRQVAMNLIINAAESIGEAQGEVRVSLAKIEIKAGQSEKDYLGKIIPPGWYACLEVADNGSGMSDETYNRVFEPFYTTKFTGRGLGMSAVLGIITSHGGAMQLFSHLGKGTTFKAFLPVQLSDSVMDETLNQNTQSAPWQGNGTILLAEDEEQIIQIAKAMLKELGFRVIEAVNGKEALELYQKNAADITLVVTDLGMPVMDGYELFRELKKLKPELPIIISSGFGDVDVTSKIARDDIAGLIGKPYRFDQLREVLKAVLEGAPQNKS